MNDAGLGRRTAERHGPGRGKRRREDASGVLRAGAAGRGRQATESARDVVRLAEDRPISIAGPGPERSDGSRASGSGAPIVPWPGTLHGMSTRDVLRPTRLVVAWSLWTLSATAGEPQFQPRMGEPLLGLTHAQRSAFDSGPRAVRRVPERGGRTRTRLQRRLLWALPPRTRRRWSERTGGHDVRQRGAGVRPSRRAGRALAAGAGDRPRSARSSSRRKRMWSDRRITPHLFGAGLVEAVPDAELLALRATSGGKAHLVQPLEGGPQRVGRFGWKSQIATLLSFTADAARNELGLTNRLLTEENAPNGNLSTLPVCDEVPDPEDGPDAQGLDRIDRPDAVPAASRAAAADAAVGDEGWAALRGHRLRGLSRPRASHRPVPSAAHRRPGAAPLLGLPAARHGHVRRRHRAGRRRRERDADRAPLGAVAATIPGP